MSKQMKLWCCLPSIALNHSITEAEFFHWLKLDALVMLLLILSRISLLILPISDLVGLSKYKFKIENVTQLLEFHALSDH